MKWVRPSCPAHRVALSTRTRIFSSWPCDRRGHGCQLRRRPLGRDHRPPARSITPGCTPTRPTTESCAPRRTPPTRHTARDLDRPDGGIVATVGNLMGFLREIRRGSSLIRRSSPSSSGTTGSSSHSNVESALPLPPRDLLAVGTTTGTDRPLRAVRRLRILRTGATRVSGRHGEQPRPQPTVPFDAPTTPEAARMLTVYCAQWYCIGIRTTIDKAGRVVIPKILRESLGLVPGKWKSPGTGRGRGPAGSWHQGHGAGWTPDHQRRPRHHR